MGKSTSFYAVRTGRKPGVYNSWPECEAQVKGFSGPRFKKFDTLKEALAFVESANPTPSYKNESSSNRIKKPMLKGRNPKKPEKFTMPSYNRMGLRDNLPEIIKSESSSDIVKNEFKEIVYTDGSSRGNGKFGARAGVGVFFGDNDPRNYSEPLEGKEQTNNRAELTAGIKAIELSSPEKILEIRTDSKYLIQGVTSWMSKWVKDDWKTSSGTVVKNRQLFEDLHSLIQNRRMPIIWTHVSAHTGIYGNEMADQLANLGAEKSSTASTVRSGINKIKKETIFQHRN